MLLVDWESLFLLRVVDLIEIEFNYVVGWVWKYVIVLFLEEKKQIYFLFK